MALRYTLVLTFVLTVASAQSLAQARTSLADKWPDYVAGEYDIQPNISYSKGSK